MAGCRGFLPIFVVNEKYWQLNDTVKKPEASN
jgi:hypothetical protein